MMCRMHAVPYQTRHGTSALIVAAQRGHPECVRLLLDAGADKSARVSWRFGVRFLLRAR